MGVTNKQVWRSLSAFAGRPIKSKSLARSYHHRWATTKGIEKSSIQWKKGRPYVVYRDKDRHSGTVAAFIAKYLDDMVARTSPQHHRNLRRYLGNFGRWCFEAKINRLSDLRRRDIELSESILSATAGPTTHRRYLEAVRAALNIAVDWDEIESNPAARVRMPINRTTKERRALTKSEVALIRGAWPEPIRSFALTCLWAGLRLNEARLLAWDDIDFARSEIAITAKPELAHAPKSTRYPSNTPDKVPLVPWLAEVLRALPRKGRFVWDRGGDRPLYCVSRWNGIAKAHFRSSGMPDANVHMLRHTFCTQLARSGVERAVMARIARHRDASTTDRYVHMEMADLHREIQKVRPT